MHLKVAVITVSDSCFHGKAEDRSGPKLAGLLRGSSKLEVSELLQLVVPDDLNAIEKALRQAVIAASDLVLTTGGTGIGYRDVTPEATSAVVQKRLPGFELAIMQRSLSATPFAALSRLICGVSEQTLIINMPGSSKAVEQCFEVIEPIIVHTIQLLRDDRGSIATTHENLQKNCSSELKSKVRFVAAERPRHSQFEMISVDVALKLCLDETVKINPKTLELGISDSVGLVVADSICSAEPLPPFPASIKDGYAVLGDGAGRRQVLWSLSAGAVAAFPEVKPGFCIRINTGALIPPGADAVVQVEDTELFSMNDAGEELEILIKKPISVGQDIRPIGCDISVGQCVLKKGSVIGPAEIGLLASIGHLKVHVQARPTVGLLSTGDEVVEPLVTQPQYGQIRDSNRHMLAASLKTKGYACTDFGIARDEPDILLSKLRQALSSVDVLVTTGSVSMGDKDLLKQVLLTDLGFSIHFGRVDMKPGKPTTFCSGEFCGNRKLVFALPGNPVSAWVTFQIFVMPTIRKLSGLANTSPMCIPVRLANKLKLDTRPEFHRAILLSSSDSICDSEFEKKLSAESFDIKLPFAISTSSNQMSSRLASATGANLLLKLPSKTAQCSELEAGSIVESILID